MRKILCAIFLLLWIPAAYAAELPEFPFVFADGEATIEVPPDIATVSFSVEQFDENELEALQVVQNRSAELIEFFMTLEIDEEDIVGYEISKQSIREKRDYTELKILGYEFSRKFSVDLKGLDQYEALAKKLLSLKNVVNIKSTFSRSDHEKIEMELVSKSCRNARENAELMANGFGVKLGGVYAISKTGFNNIATKFSSSGGRISEAYFMRAGSASINEDLLFIPSTISFQSTVTAIFRLKTE